MTNAQRPLMRCPGKKSHRRGLLFFAAVIMTAAPLLVRAQSAIPSELLKMPSEDQPVTITADTASWVRVENVLALDGSVIVDHPDYLITADHARVDLESRVVRASGNVTVKRKEDGEAAQILQADEVEIDTKELTGWLLRARLTVPWDDVVFKFEGGRIERIDDHTYLVMQGRFTWCDCGEGEVPDWSVGSDRIEVDTEGDAVVRDASVYIRDRRVAKAPYFRYPVGAERRSGVLMPEIETSSSNGFQFELPYYWVIDRSMDLTVSPRYIYDRGVDMGAEWRYNFGPVARGQVSGFAIDDHLEHEPRGGIRLIHRTDLGDQVTVAADVSLITDNEVLFDFRHRDLGDENQRALESRLYGAVHWPGMNLTAEFAAFDDLMGGDVRKSPFGSDRDEEMIQRLPAVTYTLLTRPLLGPLLFDVRGYAANYYREDVEQGRGQLFTVMPRVAVPWRFFDAVDFWLAAGYREWLLVPDQEFDRRNTATGRAEAELYASAQWERIFDGAGLRWRHTVRPELVGLYADRPDEPADDFFKTIVPDQPTELLGVHLDSRLFSRKADGPSSAAIETARIEITQLYDFERDLWRDLRIEARLGAPTPWLVDLDAYHSWEDWEWSRIEAGVGYRFGRTARVRVGYRRDTGNVRSPYFEFESAPDEALTGAGEYRVGDRHRIEYRAHYSIKYDTIVRQSLEYDYLAKQKCWGANFVVTDRIKPSDPEGDHDLSGAVNLRIAAP